VELVGSRVMKLNRIYTKLDKLSKTYPEILEKFKVEKCSRCEGFGLLNYQKLSTGEIVWDGYSFCDECNGTGYAPWENIDENIFDIFGEYFCKKCDGGGCLSCNKSGFVDWITHARGG